MNAVTAGFFFMLASGLKILSSQGFAYLLRRWTGIGYYLVIASFSMTAVSFAISGPMFPFEWMQSSITTEVIRQCVFGFALGPLFPVAFCYGYSAVQKAGMGQAYHTLFTAVMMATIAAGYVFGN